MDKIIMKNMMFFGRHGVLEEEKTLGQKFSVSARLFLSLKDAGENDDLNLTVNYGEVYEIIKQVMEKERFDLIEGVAERICAMIFASFNSIEKIQITIKKPEAPIPGIFDFMGVEIERTRPE